MKLMTMLRMEQGLSMSGLARKASMHVSSICQIENSQVHPYPGQINKIARALKWKGNPAELFRDFRGDNARKLSQD